jgi:hypothetical protein
LLGAFAVGLLAHSHRWNRPGSTPRENLKDHLWEIDHEVAHHPRESLHLLCVADLATVTTQRMPYLGPDYFRVLNDEQLAAIRATGVDPEEGMAVTAMTMSNAENEPGHIAMFVAALVGRLATADPTLRPFSDGLRVTNTLGSGAGYQRSFPLHEVYSEQLLRQRHRFGTSDDWAMVF